MMYESNWHPLWDHNEARKAETSTSPDVLENLALSESGHIRFRVAENTSAPPRVLEQLARDESDIVRRHVAKNRATPLEILLILMVDEDVAWCAEKNLNRKLIP